MDDPNGTVGGNALDKYFGTAQNLLWICTQSGTSTTAVWEVVEAAIDTD